MRVLFVTPYYYPELEFGGPPKRLHALARELVGRNHVVRVATFDSRDRTRHDEAIYDGVEVTYLPWRGSLRHRVPTSFHSLKVEIEEADVVHCYGLYNLICPAAVRLSRKYRRPYLLEPMGMFVPMQRNIAAKQIYNAIVTKWMARHASAIVATSAREAEELAGLGMRTTITVRRNGISAAEFKNLKGGAELKKRWQIAPGEKVIGFIGRISSKKNIHGLIAAFERADIRGARLVIVGPVSEPEYEQRLRRQIEDSTRAAAISFHGALYGEDLGAVWDALDLFVLPSFNENFGNAAAEAVFAGVPVLVTETCGVAPIINERAGVMVPVEIDQIAGGMERMLNPETCNRFTARREEVKRELSWDQPVTETEQLYRRIIAAGPS